MMAPSILKSDSETLVIGASGGSMITTGLASVRERSASQWLAPPSLVVTSPVC